MTTFKQTLSNNSLGILEKMLLSEAIKLKRKTKEILPHRKIYHTNFTNYEKAYNQMLEALDFYRMSSQEEITQLE